MKINEIVTEGILDRAKQLGAGVKGLSGGVSGAKAGWQAQGSRNDQTDKINKTTSFALQKWAAVAQSIQTSTGRTPTAAQAKKWFAQFSGKPAKTAPTQMSDVGIKNWLTKEVANYITNKEIPPTQRTPRNVAGGDATATQSATNEPADNTNTANDMTSRMSQSTRPAQPQLAGGVSIVSREPLVFKYRGMDYAVGDTGEWVKFGSNQPVSQTLSRFLDAQEDTLSRTAASGTPSPQAQQQTTPPTNAQGQPPAQQQTTTPAQPQQQSTNNRPQRQLSQTPSAVNQRARRARQQPAPQAQPAQQQTAPAQQAQPAQQQTAPAQQAQPAGNPRQNRLNRVDQLRDQAAQIAQPTPVQIARRDRLAQLQQQQQQQTTTNPPVS